MTRHVTADDPTRDRFGLYRLCHCLTCEGQKRVELSRSGRHRTSKRCPDCRGEGRTLQEVASCESAEALGVALVTLAREDEFSDCPIGVLDRMPECEHCEIASSETPWTHPWCEHCKGSGIKPAGTWLVKPWLPSPRNASDAGRLLRSRREDVKT